MGSSPNFASNINPLSANPTKRLNTLKQFVGKLPTNFLSALDHFVGLALKGLSKILEVFVTFLFKPLQVSLHKNEVFY